MYEVMDRRHHAARHGDAELSSLWLRAGLAFVFLYSGAAMALDPSDFAQFVPGFLLETAGPGALLRAFAICELVLAAALLSRRHAYEASVVAALTLTTITLANLDAFNILFRNVAIVCAAVALAVQLRADRVRSTRAVPSRPWPSATSSTTSEESAPAGPGYSASSR